MFKDLRTGTKLFILVGMFGILIAVAVYDLIADRRLAISSIRRELAGENDLSTVRNVYAAMLADQVLDPVKIELAKDKTEILAELARAEARAAGQIETARLIRGLDEALRHVWSSHRAATAPLLGALDKLRGLTSHIGDESGLALDSSLASRHVADILLTKLPAYAGALAEMQALLQFNSTSAMYSLPQASRVLILSDLLRSTAEQIKEELDQAFLGEPDGKLQLALDPGFSAMVSSLGPYLSSLSGNALQRQASAADPPPTAHLVYASAVNATMRAWVSAQYELDRLLRARIDILTRQLRRSLALIGGLGGLSVLASIMTHRRIVRPLERLQGLADRVSKTKDYSLRAGHKSRDEIGRLTVAFNDMLEELAVARDLEAADRERFAQRALDLLVNVTSAASTATSITALASVCLDRICATGQWQLGQVWYPDADGTCLRCSADPVFGKDEYEDFHRLSLATPLRKGQGLPGQAWERRSASWMSELVDPNADDPRGDAARRAGFRSSFAFPAAFEQQVTVIFEFRSTEDRRPDSAFVDAVDKLGGLLGDIGARLQSEQEKRIAAAALQASEDRWRSVFESTTLGIAMVDESQRYVVTNPAFRTLLGYAEEELAQLTPMDISVGEEQQLTRARLEALGRGELQHLDIEKQYRRKNGELVWVHNYASLVSGDGSKALIMGIIIDITESKRAKDALRDAQSELAHASRLTAMGQLTASIAHEINQPLQAIVSNGNAGLRWLKRDPPRLDEVGETLKQIVSDGHRASRTIASVRAIFKKDDGDRASVDVNELIVEVLELLRAELDTRGISVRTELGPELPKPAAARVQIQQVVLNLVMNAAEAMMSMPEGTRTLMVGSGLRGDDQVVITVADSGPGIDPNIAGRIFEPFFTTKAKGMGIGLAICRSIAEAHHGRLSVVPGTSQGAVFEIALPATDPKVEDGG